MREHMMSATRSAFVPQRGNIDWRNDDSFTGTRRGLRQKPAIVINYMTAARPGIRGIVFQTRSLVRGHNVGDVLNCASAINHRPPRHWLGRAPWIHVRGDAHQDFRAIRGELAHRFRKQPVITDGTTDAADWCVSYRKERFTVIFEIVRASIHLETNPGVHF